MIALPGCNVPPSRTGYSGVGEGLGKGTDVGSEVTAGGITVAGFTAESDVREGEQDTMNTTKKTLKIKRSMLFFLIYSVKNPSARMIRLYGRFPFDSPSKPMYTLIMPGVSTFDLLGDMPSAQRTLMRLFLRRVQMNMAELESALAELPEDRRLSRDDLREALSALLEKSWIRKVEQNGETHYTVQQQSSKS
jgi:hypothetical protein